MKSFLSLIHIKKLQKIHTDTFLRFPLSMMTLYVMALLFFTLIHSDLSIHDQIIEAIFSLIILFFLSAWICLSSESLKMTKKQQLFSYLGSILFSIFFYMSFSNIEYGIENLIYFFLTIIGILSFLFFAPYIKNIFSPSKVQKSYYRYFYTVSSVFLMWTILWWALSALWIIAIWATFTLFDLDSLFKVDNIIGDWIVIACIVIAPIFALSQLPQKNTFAKTNFQENIFFSFLVKFIATPFIYIYFFILYAYTVKVLLNFSEWPQGEVTWMVIGFSVFGYMSYLFSYAFSQKNQFIQTFRKVFPFAVVPQVFMLFYAIYLRINQYDLTINRYFVVVFGLWLLGISLYYIISHKKKLLIVPASLTLASIIISVWPWSVYQLPESRQLQRLEKNLTTANILQAGKIVPLQTYEDISPELSKEIYSGIDYLCDFDNCRVIKEVFPKIYTDILEKDKEILNKWREVGDRLISKEVNNEEYTEPRSWEIVTGVTEALKVKSYFDLSEEQEHIYISLNYNHSFFPLDTEWFSQMYEFRWLDDTAKEHARFDIRDSILTLPNWEIYDISTIISQLTDLFNTPGIENPLNDPSLLTFELDWAKIFVRNVNLKNPRYTWEKSTYPYYGAQWYILIK